MNYLLLLYCRVCPLANPAVAASPVFLLLSSVFLSPLSFFQLYLSFSFKLPSLTFSVSSLTSFIQSINQSVSQSVSQSVHQDCDYSFTLFDIQQIPPARRLYCVCVAVENKRVGKGARKGSKAKQKERETRKMTLTQDEIDGCRDTFLAFDKDRSGTIDVWELRRFSRPWVKNRRRRSCFK